MNNVYTDPYMPDEEDMVTVGDLRPYGHEVKYKQHIDQRTLKKRAKENMRSEAEWHDKKDNRTLCHTTSPWADCIEALEIYESKAI
jgi:hypothetical protein